MPAPRLIARRGTPLSLLLLLATLSACAPWTRTSSSTPSREIVLRAEGASATFIYGSRLEALAETSSSLTGVLQSRVVSLQIDRPTQANHCPRLRLRGITSISLSNEPVIYLDGIQVSDTCILETLPPTDVSAIAVYGGGHAPAGSSIPPSPSGLILVFTK